MTIMRTRTGPATSWVLALASLLPVAALGQSSSVDPEAARIMKRMTEYVGSLQKFGLVTVSTMEVVLVNGQKIQFDSGTRLTVQRPNKLRAERIGDVISQSFYYDGGHLTLVNPEDGYYATVPAPGTIDAMLDFARDSLDVVAPAGDLVMKDSYARLMADVTSGFVVGKSIVGGVRCDHLAFRSLDLDWQVWIEDGAKPLPRKYVITTLDVAGSPQFEIQMNDWTTAPDVSGKQFEFAPPPGAKRIEFMPRGQTGSNP
jgi:hypothetical protein